MAKVDLSGFTLGSREEKSNESNPAYYTRQVIAGLEKLPEGVLHLGETLRDIGKTIPITAPAFRGVEQAQKAIGIPSAQEFRAGSEKALGYQPGAFTPETTGEQLGQFAIGELPFLAANLATGGIPALATGAATSLGMLAGSKAGQEVGGYVGEQFNNRELGEKVGTLPGALLGAAGVHAGLTGLPTKYFPKKIYNKNVEAFENAKAERIAELEKKYLPEIARLEEGVKTEPLSLVREKNTFDLRKSESLSDLHAEHLANQSKLLKSKNAALQELDQRVIARENKIKELEATRHPEYAQAKIAAEGIKEQAQNLKDLVRDIHKRTEHGLESADRSRINGMASQIDQLTNIKKGGLDLAKAKEVKENLNAYLYDRNVPSPVKKYYREMRDGLNEWISSIGEKYPEHAQPFTAAEQKTREFKLLQKEQPQFAKEIKIEQKKINDIYNQELRNLEKEFRNSQMQIKSSKFPVEQEIFSKQAQAKLAEELNITKKEFAKARTEIGKETYDKLIKSEASQDKLAETLAGFAKEAKGNLAATGLGTVLATIFGVSGYLSKGLGALAGYLLRRGYKEAKMVVQVLKEHPELAEEYYNIIKDATVRTSPKLFNRLNDLGSDLEKYSSEENFEGFTLG